MAIGFRSTPRAQDELEGVLLPQPSARASLCVRHLRGHEVQGPHLGCLGVVRPTAGPAGRPFERPQGRGRGQAPALLGHMWVIKGCLQAVRQKEEDCFKVSILTSQTVTSLMLFIEGLANKFRRRMKIPTH